MTNYEHIKSFSLKEMAEFFAGFNMEEDVCRFQRKTMAEAIVFCRNHDCVQCALKWLEAYYPSGVKMGGEESKQGGGENDE